MKKVRLFAIAAAMGMFASTVSAADYVTKDAYVATWGNVDEIIKVDVGDKVVAPIASISVVKETRSTDPKYATTSGSLGLEDSNTCFEGFTNTVGKDSNNDGYVDADMLIAEAQYKNDKYVGTNLTTQGWLHTDAKFFPTAKTALYYVGLGGGNVTGGRFLAPGAAKNEGTYTLALAHKNLGDAEAVLKHFTEAGIVNISYDEDGYIEYADINPISVTNAKGKEYGKVVTRITPTKVRYADDIVTEQIVNALVNGFEVLADTKDDKYSTYYSYDVVGFKNYTSEEAGEDLEYVGLGFKDEEIKVKAGEILMVEEYRGAFYATGVATGTDLKDANGKEIKPVDGKIVVALSNDDKDESYSKYMTIDPVESKEFGIRSTMRWDVETGTFTRVADAPDAKYVDGDVEDELLKGYFWSNPIDDSKAERALKASDYEFNAHVGGLYYVKTPANNSDKIVIYTGDDVTLDITGINVKKETMTVGYGDNKELTVSAVKLSDGMWYPAVNNEAELTKFVEKVLGLSTIDGKYNPDKDDANEYDSWTEEFISAINNPLSGVSKVSRTNAKGEKEEYIPENSLQHYKGTFCTYSVNEGTKVDAIVTSNADSVDTTTSGVKTLTLTAKVGDEVVGTKDVKVVVAPKYQREYKNGKVVKLTAFYLDGKTPYAIYKYDWTKKTYTATFYQQDGVTVASTANGTL